MTSFYCVLVVPAHNEVASIGRCLSSVRDSRMPAGFEWKEWRILDDGSTDGTSARVQGWANENPTIPLTQVRTTERQGKIAAVKRCHENLVEEGRFDDIVVFVDADVTIEPKAMAALLGAFSDDGMAAATGWSLPSHRKLGSRSSAFQIQLAANFALELGPDASRIEGRLYAYRLGALADFHLVPGLIVEDTQLTGFLIERNLRVRSAFDAIIRVTPAASYMDFYKQTYRAFKASSLAGPTFPTKTKEITPLVRRALFRTVRADPLGAAAYCIARAVAACLNRVRPMTFTDQFLRSESTKV
jgi:glycosyltransferase involved in cell wall biosynthesis